MDEVYTDGLGNYYDASGRQLDIYDLIARGIDVAGAYAGRSPYISQDDPRYRAGQYPTRYPASGGGYPGLPSQVPAGYVPGTVNTQGFQLNWWTAALIGVVVGSFLLGKKR
jgi:hypothetical protein